MIRTIFLKLVFWIALLAPHIGVIYQDLHKKPGLPQKYVGYIITRLTYYTHWLCTFDIPTGGEFRQGILLDFQKK